MIGLNLPAVAVCSGCLIGTYVGTRAALDAAGARIRRALHLRRTRRCGQLLQRVRAHYEATGTRW